LFWDVNEYIMRKVNQINIKPYSKNTLLFLGIEYNIKIKIAILKINENEERGTCRVNNRTTIIQRNS
jgi:hypothetical protein